MFYYRLTQGVLALLILVLFKMTLFPDPQLTTTHAYALGFNITLTLFTLFIMEVFDNDPDA